MNKEEGFIEILFIIAIVFIVSVTLIHSYKRFSAVADAVTAEEVNEACKEYEMASLKTIPQKCLPYIDGIKIIHNQHLD